MRISRFWKVRVSSPHSSQMKTLFCFFASLLTMKVLSHSPIFIAMEKSTPMTIYLETLRPRRRVFTQSSKENTSFPVRVSTILRDSVLLLPSLFSMEDRSALSWVVGQYLARLKVGMRMLRRIRVSPLVEK